MITANIRPKNKLAATISTAANVSRFIRPPIAAATSEITIAGPTSRSGCQATPISAAKIASAARKSATVSLVHAYLTPEP